MPVPESEMMAEELMDKMLEEAEPFLGQEIVRRLCTAIAFIKDAAYAQGKEEVISLLANPDDEILLAIYALLEADKHLQSPSCSGFDVRPMLSLIAAHIKHQGNG